MSKKNNFDSQLYSVQGLRDDLVNRSYVIFSIIVVPVLLISLYRIVEFGWMPHMSLHIALTVYILVVTIFRKRLSYKLRSLSMITVLLLVGIIGIIRLGLSGNGSPFLICASIYAALLFGLRAGLIVMTISFILLILVVFAISRGWLLFDIDFNAYNYSIASWLTFIAGIGLLTALVVTILSQFNRHIFNLVANQEKVIKESTRELRNANRAKSEFLANMSHEIRTPMNGVLGMLRLLSKSSLNEEQRHKTNLARSSAESLLSLINDILDYSKAEAGKMELDELDFNFCALVGEIAEANALRVQQKGVELILDLAEVKHNMLQGDPGKIRQVLTNLLGNATKFTPSGEITIKASTKLEGQKVCLFCEVTDTGVGIPKQNVGKLFNVFTQVDASTTRQYGGTGLGLSICAKLCELMGGTISVESFEGKGSRFFFTIYLSISKKEDTSIADIDFGRLNVLVLDGRKDCGNAIAKQFESWGGHSKAFEEPDELINFFKQTDSSDEKNWFSGVLIDVQTVGNIKDFVEKLAFCERFKELKLVAMSDFIHISDPQAFTHRNVVAYFPKPATTSDLIKSARYLLDDPEKLNKKSGLEGDIHRSLLVHENQESLDDLSLLAVRKIEAHILLVEDNFVNQQVLVGILEEFNITADVAENGEEALNILKNARGEKQHDLVIMDCQMPVMDGYQASRAIRAGKAGARNRTITILAMTANAMVGDREKCIQAGMNDYLAKPVEAPKLLTKLHHWLEANRFEQQDFELQQDSYYSDYQMPAEPGNRQGPGDQADRKQEEKTLAQDKSTDTTNIWDKEAALGRLMGKEALLLRLVNVFLESIDELMSQVEYAVKKRDAEQVALHAHSLKGTAGNIGAVKLQALAFELEKAGRESGNEKFEELYAGIVDSVNELIEILKAQSAG
ncbi:ATP-binding protein [Aliikangiella sp. G2MR2-5]|uniref:ATP-binding protein n=1 Tax=Aliikangiella sp. G2MR2-5 TaxID=2788943 RepID=UPI0018ABF075|nr:ATP-binding protein [Aliikangiella sp. G2MR2-5]